VVPSDFGWSDIGSWKSLYDFLEKDANNNVLEGDVIAIDTRNCLVLGHDRLIATNRLQEVAVVETPDSVFVSDLEHSRDVKSIVTELKDRGRKEYQLHRTVYFPWGISKLLEQRDNYTAAELTVYPQSMLQLADEEDRLLHFFIINGQAEVSTDSARKTLRSGESLTLSREDRVIIENRGRGKLYLIQMELKHSAE
jgi:mannose-6-phosphate isomerase-like protein (cupin superfamily)